MTNDEIRALLALEAKATPGPWSVEVEHYGNSGSITIPEIERIMHDTEWADFLDWDRDLSNAEIAAAARNAIRPLAEEVLRLRKENEEHEALFDLRCRADARAIKMWRDAHPDKPLTSPDQADLCVWLMEQNDKLTEALQAFIWGTNERSRSSDAS